MQYICNKLQLLSKIIFITFCGKLKNGIYLRKIDSIEYFFALQIESVIEFECLWIGSTEKAVFLFVFKNKNIFFSWICVMMQAFQHVKIMQNKTD